MADDVGWHDLSYPACDSRRYEIYFGVKGHRSCCDNFLEAMADVPWGARTVPNPPFNVFMNSPVLADGPLGIGEPRLKAGDRITMRAEMDIVGVVSICPMDLTPTGGKGDLWVLVGKDPGAPEATEV